METDMELTIQGAGVMHLISGAALEDIVQCYPLESEHTAHSWHVCSEDDISDQSIIVSRGIMITLLPLLLGSHFQSTLQSWASLSWLRPVISLRLIGKIEMEMSQRCGENPASSFSLQFRISKTDKRHTSQIGTIARTCWWPQSCFSGCT